VAPPTSTPQDFDAYPMKYRYELPEHWVRVVAGMEEFANGAAQVSVRLRDKREFHQIWITGSAHVAAMRGYKDLPFALEDIEEIYQSDEDRNPKARGNWDFWDDWSEGKA
jgi:hypothetical protein